jgi:hypothetical protein
MIAREIKRSLPPGSGTYEADSRMSQIAARLPTRVMRWITISAYRRGVSSSTIIREIVTAAYEDSL